MTDRKPAPPVDMIRAAAARGLSCSQAARDVGTTPSTLHRIATRHGISFPNFCKTPEFAAMQKARMTTPEARARASAWSRDLWSDPGRRPVPKHLRGLTDTQRRDYRAYKDAGYSVDEALAKVNSPRLAA